TLMTLKTTINEGLRYKIGDLLFSGNYVFTSKQLHKALAIKEGDIYNENKFMITMQSIQEKYSERGYIRLMIDPVFEYDEDRGLANLEFKITENGIVYIDRIHIEGNNVTRDYVIRKQLLINEGSPFNVKKIRRTQEKIYNLGFFSDVRLDVEQATDNTADLVFVVEEQKTGLASVGAGYSSQDGMLGTIQISQTNLFGRAQRLNFLWEFGERRQNYQIGFAEPYLFGSDTSFGIDLFNMIRDREYVYRDFNDRTKSDWYKEENKGVILKFGRTLSDYYKIKFSFGHEEVEVYDVNDDTSPEHIELIEQEDRGIHEVNSVTTTLIRDTRDNVFDPSRGSISALSLKLAGTVIAGDSDFGKFTASHSWFLPTFWKFVLGFNVKAGGARHFNPSESVPIYERFYVGGAESVRGYDYRGDIGPGSGGNYMLVYNVEYKFPIVSERGRTILQGAFFCDVGGMWDDQDQIRLDIGRGVYDMRSGVGFGIRFKTPVFPIRLDWGYGLNQREGKIPAQFYFTIGQIF
ncbi:outer membrane protein assembly factor BamA, partial [bacterium]